MIGTMPICLACRHYRKATPGLTCAAYPLGIPAEILNNHVDHRQPYAGDQGIQFDPQDHEAADYATTLFAQSA